MYTYDVEMQHRKTKAVGIVPARTHGSPSSHSVRERTPCRAMLGGIGDEKRRSHEAIVLSISLRSMSMT